MFDAIKEIKVPIGVTVAILGFMFYAKVWADKEYVTQEEFTRKSNDISEEISVVSTQVASLINTTDAYVEEFRITEATQTVRDAKRDIIIAELSGATPAQKQMLAEEISRAERYKNCLVLRQPNCRHLLD